MILSAGLSPAWQQILVLEQLCPGEVNRAREVQWCASGKVLNAARAVHQLGGPVEALTLVGGSPGQAIQRDWERLGLAARWVKAQTPSRVCTTVVDLGTHLATELVPNVAAVTEAERAAFHAAYAEEAAQAGVAILIGSLPAGTQTDFYLNLLQETRGKAILDARGPELLEALAEKPFLVKPNRQELEKTLARPLSGEKELLNAMDLLNQQGAQWVVVTDAAKPIYACGLQKRYRLLAPSQEVLNPIGCGDCMAGAIAWAIDRGLEPLEALRWGVAAAADKVRRLLPGQLDPEQVRSLVPRVEVTRL
jgi:1-phosphofructokinase family hexose kinase